MTAITSVTQLNNSTMSSNATQAGSGRGYNDLGQEDFFRLLTVQIQNQDPLDPVDNKEMLAQMAQFTSLSGINTTNATLEEISQKLDLLGATEPGKSDTTSSKTEN